MSNYHSLYNGPQLSVENNQAITCTLVLVLLRFESSLICKYSVFGLVLVYSVIYLVCSWD